MGRDLNYSKLNDLFRQRANAEEAIEQVENELYELIKPLALCVIASHNDWPGLSPEKTTKQINAHYNDKILKDDVHSTLLKLKEERFLESTYHAGDLCFRLNNLLDVRDYILPKKKVRMSN